MDMPADTPLTELLPTLDTLRRAHASCVPDYAQRVADLRRLRQVFKAALPAMDTALRADFGHRSTHESLLTDGMTVLHEIDHTLAHLRAWIRPRRRPTDWLFWPARSEVRYQPLGVVGVISPWNYPVNLALMPLIAAIAAGNHVFLKPSEHTPGTSLFLRDLLREVFPEDRVAVALGGPEVAASFAGLPFDHLFFTGSTSVGKKVMAAAAPNLTPLTLELGGKSPTIIAEDFPLDVAAARIASGKWLNAGQTCIAPDYVLVPAARRDGFVAALAREVQARYPTLDRDYTRIVNAAQYGRLRGYLDDATRRGFAVQSLITIDPARAEAERLLPPTVVIDPSDEARVMQDEIFGPILPIKSYRTLDEAIAYINAHDRPLALYHFDQNRGRTERVLERTIAGGVSVNDTVLHIAQAALPFGGVGPSGMGHYHGREGFLCFSKQKPVFYQARISSMALFKPPYGKLHDFLVKFLTR